MPDGFTCASSDGQLTLSTKNHIFCYLNGEAQVSNNVLCVINTSASKALTLDKLEMEKKCDIWLYILGGLKATMM